MNSYTSSYSCCPRCGTQLQTSCSCTCGWPEPERQPSPTLPPMTELLVAREDVPDRAARIRALAEKMMLAHLGSPDTSGGIREGATHGRSVMAEHAHHWWWNATCVVDDLDRLEASEREKEEGGGDQK